MVGVIGAAYVVLNLPEVGGLSSMLEHPNVANKISVIPDFNDMDALVPFLIMPLAIQWWSVWYPGAEPGGGGYIAQRMLSAKDEKNAVGATLLFNIAHYALRPWPWILIALASLVIYPSLSDISQAFPNATLGHDLGYPAMLTLLPSGLLGLVVASLIAAFMSTISTHLNWGASYVSLDFYKRFVKPEASEKALVNIGRLTTVILMIFSAILALQFDNALDAFNILLQIGAGTGLIFILRWFWWRINAYSEITGMIVSFVVALVFELYEFGFEDHEKLVVGVAITTVAWLVVTLLTKPTDQNKLTTFYNTITPYGSGWKKFREEAKNQGIDLKSGNDRFTLDLAKMLLGVVIVYTALFGTGYVLYSNYAGALLLYGITFISGISIFKLWKK